MSVTEIKEAVSQFSPEELREFADWFNEFQQDLWDQQIEEDSKAGKLDFLIKQAKKQYREGKCKEL
jgi:hypothetical protein